MKSIFYPLLLISVLCLSACITNPAEIPTPTATATPTVSTITPTIVWFPPTATFTPFPTIYITPTADMRPGIGDILLEDNFEDSSQWSLTTMEGGSVAFGKAELTIAISKERQYLFSVRKGLDFGDYYAEITANPNLCHDDDEYGMLIRVSPDLDYYRFSLSCDGRVRLDRIYQNQASSPQPWTPSGAFPPGAPSISRLGVWAVGEEMRFFINGEYQFTTRDPLLIRGGFGVFARSSSDQSLTVNFSDLVVREIKMP